VTHICATVQKATTLIIFCITENSCCITDIHALHLLHAGNRWPYWREKMESIAVSGTECEVNKLPRSMYRGDPTYQLIAPAGHRFESCELHCIPCFSAQDVRDRAKTESVIACLTDCDCHDD
jgi:hypothetical protein